MDADAFRRLPKAEFHIHLEAAYSYATLRDLHPAWASLPQTPMFPARYRDFDEFLDQFDIYVRPALSGREAYGRVARAVVRWLGSQGVAYAELSMGANVPERLGHRLEDVARELREAFGESSEVDVALTIAIPRDRPPDENVRLLERWLATAQGLIRAFDVHGYEPGGRLAVQRPAIELARAAGLRLKAHAGEHAGPDSVREALDLGIGFVNHGVRAAEDPKLLDALARAGVVLHLCPTSNVRLGVVPRIEDLPIAALRDAGVPFTINTDDPLLFGCDLPGEYAAVQAAFGLSDSEIAGIAARAWSCALKP